MSESYPSDAILNALSGAADAEQEVLFPAIGESPYYTSFYKMLERLLEATARAGDLRVFKDGPLTFGVRAGRFADGAGAVAYAGAAAQPLTDDASNYIYLTAAGQLAVNTVGFPDPAVTPHIPLAAVMTADGEYDGRSASRGGAVTDQRGRALVRALSAQTCAEANTLRSGGNADALHVHGAAGLGMGDSAVSVRRGATDAASGTALAAAYAAAKLLTPGGNALSTTNRAKVIIWPGQYTVNLTLDAEYVDLVGLTGDPQDAHIVGALTQTAADVRLAGFTIDAADGFTFTLNCATSNAASRYERLVDSGSSGDSYGHSFRALSDMAGTWFDCHATGSTSAWSTSGSEAFVISGTFIDCTAPVDVANGTWNAPERQARMVPGGTVKTGDIFTVTLATRDGSVTSNITFTVAATQTAEAVAIGLAAAAATARAVPTAPWSAVTAAVQETSKVGLLGDDGFTVYRVTCAVTRVGEGSTATLMMDGGAVATLCFPGLLAGTWKRCIAGDKSFGGCLSLGANHSPTAVFEDCTALYNSFAVGARALGTYRRCRGGENCFGGGYGGLMGSFEGRAERCYGENNSFGMGVHTQGSYTNGTLIDCECRSVANPTVPQAHLIAVAGLKMIDCRFQKLVCASDSLIYRYGTWADANAPVFYNCTFDVRGEAACLMTSVSGDGAGHKFKMSHCRASLWYYPGQYASGGDNLLHLDNTVHGMNVFDANVTL